MVGAITLTSSDPTLPITDPNVSVTATAPVTSSSKPGTPLPNIVSITVSATLILSQGGRIISRGPVAPGDFSPSFAPNPPTPTSTVTVVFNNNSGLVGGLVAGQTGFITVEIVATDANGQTGRNQTTWSFSK